MEQWSQGLTAAERVPETEDSQAIWARLESLPTIDEEPLDADWIPNREPLPPAEENEAPPTRVLPPPPKRSRVRPPTADPRPAPPRKRKRRWLRWSLVALLLVALVLGAAVAYTWFLWGRVERVELGAVLAGSPSGTNYLIVGTDSRAGITPDNPNAGAMLDPGGERTDTVVVLRRSADGNKLMALPRDLWLPIAPGGGEQRLNSAFSNGPASLVETVQSSLGIPIDHYLEVDFAGFLSLIDALGGITVDFANPAFDTRSGLSVDGSGPVRLDSHQALAYVRSRAYTEVIDGTQVTDPTGDIGRVARQQQFLEATFDELGGVRNPATLLGVLAAMGDSLRIDDQMSLWHAAGLLRSLPDLDPESVVLPTFGFQTGGGASVLGLADGSEQALEQFR